MSFKLAFARIIDPFVITYQLLVVNRRMILPTIIGLILALTIVSQSGILIESYREQIFEEVVFQDYSEYDEDISLSLYRWSLNDDDSTNPAAFFNIETYDAMLNSSIASANYANYIDRSKWFSTSEIAYWVEYQDDYGEYWLEYYLTMISSPSAKFYSQMSDLVNSHGEGRLPTNTSEVFLLKPSNIQEWYGDFGGILQNITLNSQLNITLPGWSIPYEEEQINKTVTVVGIVEYTSFTYYYEDNYPVIISDNVTKLLWEYFNLMDLWEPYMLLFPQDLMIDLLGELSETYSFFDFEGRVYCDIFIDRSHFNAYNINEEVKKLQGFIQAFEQTLYQNDIYPNIWSRIYEALLRFDMVVFGLTFILIFVSVPVIGIALYLVTYSFRLIRKQKQEQIGILKTRGGSPLQIFTTLVGEIFFSTIIAILLGFIIGLFLTDLVMKSSDYLQFFGVSPPVKFSFGFIQTLVIWGIIFSLLLNFVRMIRMSRQLITETQKPTETSLPAWKRYYLDIILFSLGTVTWIAYMALTRALRFSEGDLEPIIYALLPILSLLALPAPFLMFFGTIMVISRFFPLIMSRIAEMLWKLDGGVNAFAIRNIVRHQQAASRAVLLITLALSFSILASSLIFSLDETEQLKYYYDNGADIIIPMGSVLNETIGNILKENVSHLDSVSGVYRTDYFSHGFIYRSFDFLFIDPQSYAQTAFTDPLFQLSQSLTKLVKELEDNHSVILFEGNLKEDVTKPKIGDNLSIQFSNETHNQIFKYRIVGTFKYWPNLYPREWYDFSRYYWMIGSLGMFEELNKASYFTYSEASYIAKIDSLDNIKSATESIYEETGIIPDAPALKYQIYRDSFDRRFTLSILNSDLILCIVVSVIGVVMFAFFTYVERGKEIGVERALGMTRIQTGQSFLVEAATILSFGTLIGLMTGIYYVTMFLQLTQMGETIPPVVISYPLTLMIQMILGILIVAGIGTIIPAIQATRKDISRILKVE
ncbi:MAG: FtsX-like permease family protein [Candidatus Heimdallarchaeota archaeon]|nr:FtsX-like permease family protein [Candidatus Heimdallarchaeota archaeon]